MAWARAAFAILAFLGGMILVAISLIGFFILLSGGSGPDGSSVRFIPLDLLIAIGGVALMIPAFRRVRRRAR
jgi:hypothetical protein